MTGAHGALQASAAPRADRAVQSSEALAFSYHLRRRTKADLQAIQGWLYLSTEHRQYSLRERPLAVARRASPDPIRVESRQATA
jgi:hypothetical protein